MAKKADNINIDYIEALANTKVKPIKMEDEMKKSSNVCPSYFSWSFIKTPIILDEF